ncbi:MAG: ubiquinol-cytochrome c reductase iron-sulfur subunit [Polyangiaceae bacterium]
MYPRVLFEPPSQFKLGRPSEYAPRSVSDKWIRAYRFWLVRFDDRFVAVSAICTHLGCTPRYLNTEDKFKCPCHGSGYRGFASGWQVIATNFEGPAPRPMERFKLSIADDGQILVDKSVLFRIEKDEASKPGAYLPFA